MGSFDAGIRELAERVGDGLLEGIVRVDQPHAAVQEVGYWKTGPNAGAIIRNHPRGGKSHALGDALTDNSDRYMQRLAHDVYEPGGLRVGMIDVVEDIASDYYENAPRETDTLRNSAHPMVVDDGDLAYDRAPVEPRQEDGPGRPSERGTFDRTGRMRRRRRRDQG